MSLPTNPVKRALQRGETVIGTWISELTDPSIATILARLGFQFVYVDGQHGPFSMRDFQAISHAARAAGTVPIVRPPTVDEPLIGRLLDVGAMGVMVPGIASAEQVRRIVRGAKFYPGGRRGMTMPYGPHTDYFPLRTGDYEAVNDEILVAASIEVDAGIQDVENIASVPGLDVLIVGRWDLSQDLGIPGQVDDPRVVERVERVIDAANRHGIASGMFMPTVAVAREWMAKGMRWIPCGSEVLMFMDGGRRVMDALRE